MANYSEFKKDLNYPHEGFVLLAVEEYFLKHDFEEINIKHIDYACINPKTAEKWIIEAKGETKAINVDFNTCIGQIVQRMEFQDVNYAIALPNIPVYIKQCSHVKQWVRKALNLYWLLIDEGKNVTVISPDDSL